jgi:hypothetical protein
MMADGCKVGNGLKQGNGLGPNLFNIALKYAIRHLSVRRSKIHNILQVSAVSQDMQIVGRMKGAVAEVYEELKEKAEEVGLNITITKTKAMVQNRRRRRISEILTNKDHDIEVVRGFKYMGTVINNTNDETEEIGARIQAANKAYSSLQTVFRSQQIHCSSKIRLYKPLINPALLLWKCNLDPKTNDRTNAVYI